MVRRVKFTSTKESFLLWSHSAKLSIFFFEPVTFYRKLTYLSMGFIKSLFFFSDTIVFFTSISKYIFGSFYEISLPCREHRRMNGILGAYLCECSGIGKNFQYDFRLEL